MGAWSEKSFGNDSANDWKDDFLQICALSSAAEGLALVASTLRAVTVEGYLDVDDGCRAIAACEVLARLAGRFGVRDSYSRRIDEWVLANGDTVVPPDLVRQAVAALDRIAGPDSELAGLWSEGPGGPDGLEAPWRNAMADLRRRVLGE